MYSNFKEQAIDYVKQAVEEDNAGNYAKAFPLYMNALEYFRTHLKYEKNPKIKEAITQRFTEYLRRAEEIRAVLDDGGAGPAANGSAAVATRSKTKPKDGEGGNGGEDSEQSKLRAGLNSAIIREKPNVKWNDVAGLESAKQALQEAVILPVKFPQFFVGKRRPWRAFLLYGPPGTGKSYLAKAVATEADSTFFSVSSSDLVSKWMGESEKLVSNLFEMARESAPSIIFVDEIDSLCGQRGEGNESEASRRIKTELLVQMQGVGNDDEKVLVLAATNTPYALDQAIRRRFDKRIYIPLPDLKARQHMFKVHLGDTPHNLTESDFEHLARRTEGFSGSDIAVCVKDVLFEPVRKTQDAMYFVKTPDGILVPCGSKQPGAVQTTMQDLAAKGLASKIIPPPISKVDFDKVLARQKPTVSKADLEVHEKKLEHLELSGNALGGGIPRSLGNCTGLRSLILYSNLLQEVIPAELGLLTKLEVLDLSRNSISGPIPSELGNCAKLSVLVLSNLFDPLPKITYLEGDSSSGQPSPIDEFNFFEGLVPSAITALPKLKMMWAPRVFLQGTLPDNWGSCENLEMVNFGQNLFAGDISQGFSQCKKLHFLDLSSNRLTGELNEKLLAPCLTVFDVSENLLSGSVPRFNYTDCSHVLPSLGGYTFEQYGLPSTYLSFFARKVQTGFNLLGNEDVGDFAVYHNFAANNFTGGLHSMPIGLDTFQKQTVYAFLAGENKLTGPFPGDLFEKCDGLKTMIVNISDNRISGQIPANVSSICKSLRVLDASGNQITRSIPHNFGDLVSLISLNLSWNMLQGSIPSSLGQIRGLKFLALAGNNLTGTIPTSLGQLQSLEVLELSSNVLSGEIPKDLVNLRNLTVLLLNNNTLLGQIPSGLVNATALSTFNVSFNNLSGPLPVNLTKCNSFLGNPFLQSCRMSSSALPSSEQQGRIGDSQNYAAAPTSPSPSGKRSSFNSIEIASITSASAIVSVLLALIVLFFYTRKWNSRSRIGGSTRKEVTIFTDIGVPLTFEDVVRATGSFNASNCIGSGGFGATYKAEISPGVLVAIKRLAVGRFQGVQQFDAEIKTLGRLRHSNLVTLIGYHASETEMFLIYNYLPGGNLEKFIQERSTRAVDWRILYKIALDIARALAYLHDQCVPRVLHRDVKPSNILLDEDFNAYLSDFGLARLLGTSETHATTGVAGTFGYVAPEYAMTCRVSDKADVYSYGVVLLELLSDKKALDPSFSSFGNGFNIVQWACMLMRQGRSKDFFTAGLWEAGPHDDLVEVLHLAIVCTVESLSTRPTMKQVVRRLKQLQPPSC